MKKYPDLYLRIWAVVETIPKGRVSTYGQIAQLCDLRRQARLVGYALHNLPNNSNIPWHRVINSKGRISLPRDTGAYSRQRRLLEKEGIVFKGDRIDLSKFGFVGSSKMLPKAPSTKTTTKMGTGNKEHGGRKK